jgi:hypothetical protein
VCRMDSHSVAIPLVGRNNSIRPSGCMLVGQRQRDGSPLARRAFQASYSGRAESDSG